MGHLTIPGAALIALVLVGTGASAQTLEILGPGGAAPPEGFPVALLTRDAAGKPVAGSAAIQDVEGGTAHAEQGPAPLIAFTIVPKPGVREVKLRAKSGALTAERTFAIGPPAGKVALALEDKPPVKGKDTAASIDVRVLKPDGALDAESPPPVLQANVGSIQSVDALEPGHYRAKYQLPSTRYPEVAVIVAFAPWPHPGAVHGAIGSLQVPLASAVDLPGQTERNAQFSVEIAGVTFGPTQAGPDGHFLLPVVVPPGYRYAKATAVDRAGNRRSSKLDLALPPTDQLSCVMNPRRLPADGVARARIVCATSDPYGAPQKNAAVELRVSQGQRSERRTVSDGVYEWIYNAPAQLPSAGKPATVSAQWKEGRNVSRDELQFELVQGPAAKLEVEAAESIVHLGGKTELTAKVRDGLGRPREEASVSATAALGTVSAPVARGGGVYAFEYLAPADGDPAATSLSVRASGPAGSEPAELVTWVDRGEAFVGVVDLAGWPVPEQRVRVGDRVVVTGRDGSASLGPLTPGSLDVRHEKWPGLAVRLYVLDEATAWPLSARPGSPTVTVPMQLAPATPVIVQFAVKGRDVTYWVEDPQGKVLEGRKLAVVPQGAEIARTKVEGARTSVTLSRAPAQLSVSDVETGVTGLAEVSP